jgi:hypothetical protein
MPYANDAASNGLGDLEKLQRALEQVAKKFGSIDDVLQAFGLANMPTAQRYGILFGCVTFACTIAAVGALLVLGGTFKRLGEQKQGGAGADGGVALLSASEARQQRALLYEHLLESRARMVRQYDPSTGAAPQAAGENNTTATTTADHPTQLMKLLWNLARNDVDGSTADAGNENNSNTANNNKKNSNAKSNDSNKGSFPPFYEENYLAAYRKCQDKPGGRWRFIFHFLFWLAR